ncbi:MAG: tRNA lysidine(34) synthetase TilS [Methylacidiphilales bacterium]|nr:tRNA lysidine(34) synthetase TilS [Candidatus Methylacidiphilales bacterium]MDW8348706.1 tRNA lysidine(34) synthetase TilS [Verrucomicrobiae bacterium]
MRTGSKRNWFEHFDEALCKLPLRFIYGLSGGVDSVALLHKLVGAGYKPVVCHFNHRWRSQADSDAKFCNELAKKYQLDFFIGCASDAELETKEEVARRARLSFFERVSRAIGIYDVVLAHHADDVVETYLLQLFRGGNSAAFGIKSPARWGDLTIWRPWLSVWRSEIKAYAEKEQLKWVEDCTNKNTQFHRNWIRHELLPLLEKQFHNRIREAIWRRAMVSAARAEWISDLVHDESATDKLSVHALRAWPVGKQREVIYYWLRHKKVSDIDYDDVENIRLLAVQEKPARINLSQCQQAYRKNGWIQIRSLPGTSKVGSLSRIDSQDVKG